MKRLLALFTFMLKACQPDASIPIDSNNLLPPSTTNIRKGEQLFLRYCQSCHQSIMERGTGPALGGVTQRRNRKWLHDFTRNNLKMRTEGDSIALALASEYNYSPMDLFPDLDSMDIENIYAYVDSVYEAERPRVRLRRVYPYLVD